MVEVPFGVTLTATVTLNSDMKSIQKIQNI